MRTTQDWQAADARHFLHPFTDFQALAKKGSRVITRADNIYLWDSDGNKILDAMSGLWCVNVGYGQRALIDAATKQLETLPFYNAFFQTATPPAIELAELLAEVSAAAIPACVLRRLGLGGQRHRGAHGAPLLGRARPAAAQRHHQPLERATTAARWRAPRSAA